MINYRVSTNTNISNKTTRDKTTTKQRKMDQLRLFTPIYDLQNISVDLQTACGAETHLAEGATERGKLRYVPSGNTNADCFQGSGALFSVSKGIY
jgi:hypothetical protein